MAKPRTSAAPATSSTAPATASWVIGNCFVDRSGPTPQLTATVRVRNNDTKVHTYRVQVQFGTLGQDLVTLSQVAAGQTENEDAAAPAGSGAPPSGAIPCTITRVVDETGQPVTEGPPIPPPPDVPPPEPAPTTTRPVPTTKAPTTPEPPTTEPLPTPPGLEPT